MSQSESAFATRIVCDDLCGNQPVNRVTGTAMLSSWRRVDGVKVDAMIQHERAVNFDFHTARNKAFKSSGSPSSTE